VVFDAGWGPNEKGKPRKRSGPSDWYPRFNPSRNLKHRLHAKIRSELHRRMRRRAQTTIRMGKVPRFMLVRRRNHPRKEDQQNAKHPNGQPPVASPRHHPLQALHIAEYSTHRPKSIATTRHCRKHYLPTPPKTTSGAKAYQLKCHVIKIDRHV